MWIIKIRLCTNQQKCHFKHFFIKKCEHKNNNYKTNFSTRAKIILCICYLSYLNVTHKNTVMYGRAKQSLKKNIIKKCPKNVFKSE